MCFIDNDICHIGHCRSLVVLPSFRVGGIHIHDSSFLTIHAHGFGEDARALLSPFAALVRANGVELTHLVSFDGGSPEVAFLFLECDHFKFRSVIGVVQTHFHLFSDGRPEGEGCFLGRINALVFQFVWLGGATD